MWGWNTKLGKKGTNHGASERGISPIGHGFRKDAIDAMKELKLSVLRWPGGCFAGRNHWQASVGETRKRPNQTLDLCLPFDGDWVLYDLKKSLDELNNLVSGAKHATWMRIAGITQSGTIFAHQGIHRGRIHVYHNGSENAVVDVLFRSYRRSRSMRGLQL